MEFNNSETREHSILSLRQIDNKNKGIQIDVEHLSYSVQTGHSKSLKKILDDVSFKMIPGSLTALMGPSGAGKSTLLDLLADRKLVGEWSGDVYFNNGPRSKFFDRDSAYILQDDLQIATLTVRETVYFAASFKLPEGTSQEDINKRVDLLLELMCLSHIQDSFVGDATHRGISGGQLKRLSIAVEMVALPFIVFLDEPTSGLDSTMALDVMQTVRRLAEENRTCIATIHQPSPEVFELFDYVVLLSEGRLIYFGLVSQIQEYFCNQVLSYPFEEGTNPAEFIIEISEGLLVPTDRSTPLTAIEMERVFNNSPYKYLPELSNQKERISVADEEAQKPAQETLYSRLHATTKWTQFQLLMYRNFIAIIRDKDETIAHFAKNFCVGLTFGIIFYDQANISKPVFDENGLPTNDVSNVSSLLFISLMFIMMSNIQAIPHLLSRNLIFKREIASFAYAVSPYWLSHSISIIPMQFLGYLLFTITCFFLNGYPVTGSYFFYYFFVIFLAGLSTYYYAMLLAAMIPQENVALGVFSIMFLFFTTFVGYSISITDIPDFWSWAPYVDYARWAFEGLMVNQWEDYDDDSSGQTVLEMYDFDDYNKNNTFWIMLLVCGIFMAAVYIALRPPVKKLKKVPYIPSLGGNTTISPLLDDKRNVNGLKDNLLTEEDKRDFESFSAVTPRFKDGMSISRVSNNNSIVEAPKVPSQMGYNLTFHNLCYSIDPTETTSSSSGVAAKEPLRLLQNVTGRVESTEMLALMGSSGAGKSTLLDVLADRKTIGTITGNIYINGHLRTPELMQSTAYVMQDSAHLGYLTVRETLQFAANFRMAQHEPQELKDERVNDLLSTLRLDHIADSIVGNEETRGISGGQKRRLSIGVEIVHLPKLIFLDEPTTGLDSASANEVISVVRILANQNRTVICTIHQPSAKCFAMFDKVLLLGKGQVIYFGTVEDMKGYFMNCVYQFPYKAGRNVADYMVDIGSGTFTSGVGNHEIVEVPQLVNMYASSPINQQVQQQIQELIAMDKAKCPLEKKEQKPLVTWWEKTSSFVADYIPGAKEEFSSSQSFQINTLLHRLYLERARNPVLAVAPIARGIVTGLLFGSIYFDLGSSYDSEDYTNRLSLFFFILMSYLMPHLDDMADLQNERNLFYRERSSRAYSVFSYWLSRMTITIIPNLIGCFIYSVLIYYMCGLRDHDTGGGKFFLYFFFIGFVCDQLSYLFASIISNVSSSMQVAASLFPVFVFFMVGFEGFIIYLPNFPDWISWMAFFSFTRYLFQGLVMNEFSGNSDLPLSSSYVHNLGFQSLNTSDISFILLVFGIIMAFTSYLTLYYIRFERR